MGVQIFISYRRDGGREIARNIYERLSLKGYNTFFDYDSMRNGAFNTQIYKAIEQCSDFIIILTNNSLQRCNERGDWVLLEIEYAIKKGKNIILLAPEDYAGFPEVLPQSIEVIRLVNIIFLSSNYYNASIDKLLSVLTVSHFLPKRIRTSIIILSIIFIAGSVFLLFKYNLSATQNNLLKDCTSRLFLMRYDDLNLKENGIYNSTILKQFHFNDSIDDKQRYIVYPSISNQLKLDDNYFNVEKLNKLKLPKIIYHLPVLRIKLKSDKNKTVVFNRCFVEIDSCSVDATNYFRFFLYKQNLIISNEGGGSHWESCTLHYSWLHGKESFTDYKNKSTLKYFDSYIIIPTNKNSCNHLVGEIKFEDGQRIMFKYNSDENNRNAFDIKDSIPNPRENKEITVVDIKPQNSKSEIEVLGFNRSLVRGEVDDDFYMRIKYPINSVCRIRIRLEAIEGNNEKKLMYSNYVHLHSFTPKTGICFP